MLRQWVSVGILLLSVLQSSGASIWTSMEDDDGGEVLPAYDEHIALTMAEFCGAAYACGSLGGCKNWSCIPCQRHPNTEVLRFHSDVTSGIVGYDHDREVIILAYSGTQQGDVVAWMNNINGELVSYPKCADCMIHAGFYSAYSSVEAKVKQRLSYVLSKYPTAPIWVTGHSLGGALATLTVADLYGNYSLPVQLIYTFGQPRVGNPAFAKHFQAITEEKSPFYRVVHGKDPVPHIPPVLLGFWHPPTEIFYTPDQSSYKTCDKSGEDFYCSNSYLFDYDVKDHLKYFNVSF